MGREGVKTGGKGNTLVWGGGSGGGEGFRKGMEPGLGWWEALRALFTLPASELSPLWWGRGRQDARGLAGKRGRGKPGVKSIS